MMRGAALALGMALGLAACSSGPKGGAARPAIVQPITTAAQMSDVIALLDAGDATTAKAKLDAMLKADPADASAAILRDSIVRDPTEMLGMQSFDYELRAGDTMMSISQRHLGSALKFYALARYNGIAIPSAVAAGRTIRIPGEAPRTVATPKPAPAPKSSKPRTADAAAPRTDAARPAAPTTDPRRAAQLRGAGLGALAKGQVDRAVGLLRMAAASDPGNALIRRDLDRAQRIKQTVTARR